MNAATPSSDPRAEAVLQAVLDGLTDAIWTQDAAALFALTTSPHTIHTKEAAYIYHHDAALSDALAMFSRSIHSLGVTQYRRIVVHAGFVGDDVIEGLFTSQFLNGEEHVFPSYGSQITLVRRSGQFLMRNVRNYIEVATWPALEQRGAQAKDAVFDDETCAQFLDDIGRAFDTRDLALWRSRLQLPFSLIRHDGPLTLHTDDEVTQNFADCTDNMAMMQVDTVLRTPVKYEVSDKDTVIVTFRTDLLSRGMRTCAPYTSSALLHHTPEGWKMSSILNPFSRRIAAHPHTPSNGEDE